MRNAQHLTKRNVSLANDLKSIRNTDADLVLTKLLNTLCESLDSPRSLTVKLLFSYGEHEQLLELVCDPKHYTERSAKSFADDYFVTMFLSKYKFLKLDRDPEKVAIVKFFECEEVCKATNRKFQCLSEDPSKWDPLMHSVFHRARRKIARVLGRPNLDVISDLFGWGPGATSAAKGSKTTIYDKFMMNLDVTSNSLIMGHCCVNSTPSWVNCQLQTDSFPSVSVSLTRDAFNIVRGNEIVFVPKNAKTHRVIAIEPHVNSYLQKGFGGYIRRRLKRFAGVDLDDQTINQQLALLGSLTGSLATIDLSSASDMISKELVKFLLPDDWYVLLDQIRSKQGILKKENIWLNYEKFSSMGNGFTFELESLIFWALVSSSVDECGLGGSTVSVYGDDIICHVDAYPLVADTLSFAGFAINSAKSFVDGLFRESCGKDYFMGHEVRPLFLKERIANVETIYKLANGIRRYSHSRNFNYGCDRRFLPAWVHLLDGLSPFFRSLIIPEGFGDGGLIGNFDEARPSLASSHRKMAGWQGWIYKTLTRDRKSVV